VASQAQLLLFAVAFAGDWWGRDAPCLSAASAWRDSEALPGLYWFLLVDIEKHRILLEASSQLTRRFLPDNAEHTSSGVQADGHATGGCQVQAIDRHRAAALAAYHTGH